MGMKENKPKAINFAGMPFRLWPSTAPGGQVPAPLPSAMGKKSVYEIRESSTPEFMRTIGIDCSTVLCNQVEQVFGCSVFKILKDGEWVATAETREKAEGYVSASLKVEEMERHVGGDDELKTELEEIAVNAGAVSFAFHLPQPTKG